MEYLKLDEFLTYSFLSDLKLDPWGEELAYVRAAADVDANGYTTDIYLVSRPAADAASVQLTHSGKVKSYVWLPGGRIAYTEFEEPSDAAPYGRTALKVIDTASGEEQTRFSLEGAASLEGVLDSGNFVFSRGDNIAHELALEGLSGDERLAKCAQLKKDDEVATVFDEYPFWFNGRGVINKIRRAVYVCDADSGALKRVTPFGFRTEYIAVEGALIAYDGCFVEPIENYLTGAYVYDERTDSSVCVQKESECHFYGLSLWNGKAVLLCSKMDHYGVAQSPDIILADPKTGARTQLCGYKDEVCIGNPVGSDCRLGGGLSVKGCGEWLYFIRGVEDSSHIWRCDAEGRFEPVYEREGSVDYIDVRNGTICMVCMYDMRLEEIYLLEAGGKQAVRVTGWNDELYQSKPPVMPEKLNFTDSAGVEIHGFVLKPVGYEPGRKYPVILDIHGGPQLSYGAVYYHEMQYWANHGYFVIFCNPTGGEGRGNEFAHICGRFGTIDYEDLMQFCDEALKAYPAMDAARMGVTGGSYGGFMTNWIIGHTDRFAAAASQRSISNVVSMEGASDIGTLFAREQIGATTHTSIEKAWDNSPLKYAVNCKTPTLFIHAEQDYRCWMAEALQMYTTLINNGVQTRLCLFHKENHELSRGGRPAGRLRRLMEITNWMDKFLKAE